MNREVGVGSHSLSHSYPVPDKPYGFCGLKAPRTKKEESGKIKLFTREITISKACMIKKFLHPALAQTTDYSRKRVIYKIKKIFIYKGNRYACMLFYIQLLPKQRSNKGLFLI